MKFDHVARVRDLRPYKRFAQHDGSTVAKSEMVPCNEVGFQAQMMQDILHKGITSEAYHFSDLCDVDRAVSH